MRPTSATIAVAAVLATAGGALAQEELAYLDDRSTPEAVISSYFNAIDRHEYARAWSYYQDGEGVQPFDQFAAGYETTASVVVSFGTAAEEGAAGSTYWTLPVRLDATSTTGEHSFFSGCYTLRLAQPANQAEPPFRPLHIVEGKLKPARATDFAPAECGD
jgi:hypothetical protein